MKDKFTRNTIILFVIAFVCIAVPAVLMDLPLGMPLIDAYTAQIITLAGVNAIMAISVNVICGITGQLSLGQAGFQALGAYSVIILTDAGIPFHVSFLIGELIEDFFGLFIGIHKLIFLQSAKMRLRQTAMELEFSAIK